MKRLIDVIFSLVGIICLSPVFIIIAILISLESRGGVLYKQKRTGKHGTPFNVFKFRTMYPDSFAKGALTIGNRDPRITKIGYHLRKYKLDELPQLFNVLFGTMSFVGPRPEVAKYTDMYTAEQRRVLSIKPGITDYASIKYRNENEILARSEHPERTYIEEVMPEKLTLNMHYINDNNVFKDVVIILKTFRAIIKH